jgi:hypothetical protein
VKAGGSLSYQSGRPWDFIDEEAEIDRGEIV